jgi:hypothetical protein
MLWRNMGNLKNKWKYAPNCQLHRITPVERLRLLGGEGVSLDVDGFKAKDEENGKIIHKRDYARI